MQFQDLTTTVVIVGHVDHGKSTILGRLLELTNTIPSEKINKIKEWCQYHSRPFEYSYLLDSLKEEQKQGITIDCTRIYLRSAFKKYLIIDTPGHKDFIKNMLSGASQAELAWVVIDAQEGIQENTKRHLNLLKLLHIKNIFILINKMDLVNYKESVFQSIKKELIQFSDKNNFQINKFIPMAGYWGEGLMENSQKMPWYQEDDLMGTLDHFQCTKNDLSLKDVRMPVQSIFKFTKNGDDRRIVVGKLISGHLKEGDLIVFHPSQKQTKIKKIESFPKELKSVDAHAQDSIGFTMEDPLFIERGEVISKYGESEPEVSDSIYVQLYWIGQEPLKLNQKILLKAGTKQCEATLVQLFKVLNSTTLDMIPEKNEIHMNEFSECQFILDKKIAYDVSTNNFENSCFVLKQNNRIVGGGTFLSPLHNADLINNIRKQKKGTIYWFTGLSGSGKTTLCQELIKEFSFNNIICEHLDGDEIRMIFPHTGFSDEARNEHIKRVGHTACLLAKHGIQVFVSLISPFCESRDFVRNLSNKLNLNFIEIYVSTPFQVCEKRDVKGLYAQVKNLEIKNFTGMDSPYEAPLHPEVIIDTSHVSIQESVLELKRKLTIL